MSEQQAVQQKTATPFEYAGNLVISVNVSDLDRSIEWYREMLAFEVSYKLDQYGWCEMKSPLTGVYVGLGQVEDPKVTGCTPTWNVKDIEAARAHLESNGVRFDGDTYEIDGMVKLTTFYDPDGNPYMFAQNLQTEYRQGE
jgi:catechol 2,3-dioxygenase-like lactoylglutathione lyase family enzyme